jgi:ABC-type branched-subunit amino acid transport system permease subunit
MNFRKRFLSFCLVAVICAIAVWLVLAFTGVLDSGKFEIVQSETVSPNHIAMLGVRSYNTALTGATWFVVIDNHLYSAKELKKAFYSSRPVFVAGRDGLHVQASGSSVLVIECKGCSITKDLFEKQRFEDDGITIRYVGFP